MAVALPELDEAKVRWFRRQLRVWAKVNLRNFPWRNTRDPYAIFIAEFLLQKTGATTVLPIYNEFLHRYPTLEDLAAAPLQDIAELMRSLGLFFRAERLYQSVRQIQTEFDGSIPRSQAELLELPGVGIYTARAILANAFGQKAAVLDTNVARIIERFFGVRGERVKSRCKLLWGLADRLAPARQTHIWNLTLLDFGALVCTARSPQCDRCPLQRRCCYGSRREAVN